MQEIEDLNNNEILENEIIRTNFTRYIASLIFVYNINENISMINTTYLQNRISNFSDYRFLNELNVLFEINSTISLNIDFEYRFDNMPPSTLIKRDVNVNYGTLIQF